MERRRAGRTGARALTLLLVAGTLASGRGQSPPEVRIPVDPRWHPREEDIRRWSGASYEDLERVANTAEATGEVDDALREALAAAVAASWGTRPPPSPRLLAFTAPGLEPPHRHAMVASLVSAHFAAGPSPRRASVLALGLAPLHEALIALGADPAALLVPGYEENDVWSRYSGADRSAFLAILSDSRAARLAREVADWFDHRLMRNAQRVRATDAEEIVEALGPHLTREQASAWARALREAAVLDEGSLADLPMQRLTALVAGPMGRLDPVLAAQTALEWCQGNPGWLQEDAETQVVLARAVLGPTRWSETTLVRALRASMDRPFGGEGAKSEIRNSRQAEAEGDLDRARLEARRAMEWVHGVTRPTAGVLAEVSAVVVRAGAEPTEAEAWAFARAARQAGEMASVNGAYMAGNLADPDLLRRPPGPDSEESPGTWTGYVIWLRAYVRGRPELARWREDVSAAIREVLGAEDDPALVAWTEALARQWADRDDDHEADLVGLAAAVADPLLRDLALATSGMLAREFMGTSEPAWAAASRMSADATARWRLLHVVRDREEEKARALARIASRRAAPPTEATPRSLEPRVPAGRSRVLAVLEHDGRPLPSPPASRVELRGPDGASIPLHWRRPSGRPPHGFQADVRPGPYLLVAEPSGPGAAIPPGLGVGTVEGRTVISVPEPDETVNVVLPVRRRLPGRDWEAASLMVVDADTGEILHGPGIGHVALRAEDPGREIRFPLDSASGQRVVPLVPDIRYQFQFIPESPDFREGERTPWRTGREWGGTALCLPAERWRGVVRLIPLIPRDGDEALEVSLISVPGLRLVARSLEPDGPSPVPFAQVRQGPAPGADIHLVARGLSGGRYEVGVADHPFRARWMSRDPVTFAIDEPTTDPITIRAVVVQALHSVTAKVVDAETGEGIAGATLIQTAEGTSRPTRTRPDGTVHFGASLLAPSRLTVTAPGFEKAERDLTPDDIRKGETLRFALARERPDADPESDSVGPAPGGP